MPARSGDPAVARQGECIHLALVTEFDDGCPESRMTFPTYAATSSRPKSWPGNVRRPTNISSGSFRLSMRQSATPLLATASGNAANAATPDGEKTNR